VCHGLPLLHYSWMVQWSLHTTGPLSGRTSGPSAALGGGCMPVPQNGGVRRPGSGRGMRLTSLGGGREAAGVATGGVGSAGPALLAVSSDTACEHYVVGTTVVATTARRRCGTGMCHHLQDPAAGICWGHAVQCTCAGQLRQRGCSQQGGLRAAAAARGWCAEWRHTVRRQCWQRRGRRWL
jgi:hypothetical protein